LAEELLHPAQGGIIRDSQLRRPLVFMLALLTLWIDFITGPTILFPIWFGLPVIITAWYDGFPAASGYAVALPLARLAMKFIWPVVPWPMSHSYINFVIRILALETMAYLTARVGLLTREVRVLQGLLPICTYCHRMKTETGTWERLEAYVQQRSEASFTHGICPDCFRHGA
jgi:hypothetical protein